MFCSHCGKQIGEKVTYCRHCGASNGVQLAPRRNLSKLDAANLRVHDPDELTSNGIGSVIMGDGFFMVAVILSATQTPVSSLLWLFLLIPAFIFFGKGFADVIHARQIRRAEQLRELSPPSNSSFPRISASAELPLVSSVTDRTTRELT